MQKTTNYKLPKWEKTDRILMDDFNGMTGTLDTALHGVAVSAEAAQAAADSEATARANAVTAEATARESADAALRTAVDGKQAKLTGAATSIAANNLTASRALVSDANGKVAVSAVTAAELGCLDGVTSAIQTQLGGKQATLTGGATTIAANNLTASRALVSDANGKVAVSAVTATELGYLDGVTSAVQTQLNGKAASSHTHAQSAITGLTAALAERPCIEFSTYVGGDSKTKKVFTFSKPPKAVFILGHWTASEKYTQCILGLFLQGAPCGTMFSLTHNSSASTNVPQSAWSGNTLTLTPPSSSGANAEAILDSSYYTYRVAAFC